MGLRRESCPLAHARRLPRRVRPPREPVNGVLLAYVRLLTSSGYASRARGSEIDCPAVEHGGTPERRRAPEVGRGGKERCPGMRLVGEGGEVRPDKPRYGQAEESPPPARRRSAGILWVATGAVAPFEGKRGHRTEPQPQVIEPAEGRYEERSEEEKSEGAVHCRLGPIECHGHEGEDTDDRGSDQADGEDQAWRHGDRVVIGVLGKRPGQDTQDRGIGTPPSPADRSQLGEP